VLLMEIFKYKDAVDDFDQKESMFGFNEAMKHSIYACLHHGIQPPNIVVNWAFLNAFGSINVNRISKRTNKK
jgi:hypothetical protein